MLLSVCCLFLVRNQEQAILKIKKVKCRFYGYAACLTHISVRAARNSKLACVKECSSKIWVSEILRQALSPPAEHKLIEIRLFWEGGSVEKPFSAGKGFPACNLPAELGFT